MAPPKRKSPETKKAPARKAPAKRKRSAWLSGVSFIARYPRLISGVAIFSVVFSFVAANALWYQPHHPSPFMATRGDAAAAVDAARAPAAETGVTTFRIQREEDLAAQPKPAASPLVADMQKALTGLNLYDGPADGVNGPKTVAAIQFYQETEGLEATGEASQALLDRMKAARAAVADASPPPDQSKTASVKKSDDVADLIRAMDETGSVPIPASAYPEPAKKTAHADKAKEAPAEAPVKRVMLIQKALVGLAYGDIAVDGKAGAATKAAIRSFEKAYRLPVTGEPSDAVLKKLKSIGAL
ncbi:peptidoglycan-binding domain-containing protein [Rhizobium sp. TRM95796]|uniref:peptidoglycan-binding domain-containing protein n=1 Tax=Rhizobium sp. TRM95796 TaxID=2979862 RepID=UPI0021E71E86|nr:peptidoglycan-binding protein [Rhizobium sp. TRM95796]MCV3766645.1 peptidoglycan-binding protein [Rhizobium sp. TRM95796]